MKKMSTEEFRRSLRRSSIIIPKPENVEDGMASAILAAAAYGYIHLVELESPLPNKKFFAYYQSLSQLSLLEDFDDNEVIEEPVGALWITKDGKVMFE